MLDLKGEIEGEAASGFTCNPSTSALSGFINYPLLSLEYISELRIELQVLVF